MTNCKYIVLTLLCMPCLLRAQVRLTLEEAIHQAQETSLQAKSAYYKFTAEDYDYKEWLAGFTPQLMLSSTPRYQQMSNTHNYIVDANLELTQKIKGFGGYLYASSSTGLTGYLGSQADQIRESMGSSNIFQSTPLLVGYRQELLGYNPFKWERMIHELHNKQIRAEHAYELAQIAETTTSYFFNFLACRAYCEMYSKNVATADTLYNIGKEKYAITSIRKDELISLELQLLNMKNGLRIAEKDLSSARQSLLSHLNMSADTPDFDVVMPATPDLLVIDEKEAIAYAEMYNPDYTAYQENILSQKQQVEYVRKESGFKASVDISVGRQNTSPNFAKSFNMKEQYTVASVTLSVPLVDGGAAHNRRKAAESRLEMHESNLSEAARLLRENVINTLREFNVEQTHLAETRRAIELADESYEQNQYNYAQGLIDISTFTLAQDRKDNAHNNYINSLQSYWQSYYKLMRLTMYDFRNKKALL